MERTNPNPDQKFKKLKSSKSPINLIKHEVLYLNILELLTCYNLAIFLISVVFFPSMRQMYKPT
ncbi:MAG: hypothetical protein K0S23_795 [Fluviicola sp.]|jgi:hypothetical protein|nr:hypothetical protein [Fluviicola sp.]